MVINNKQEQRQTHKHAHTQVIVDLTSEAKQLQQKRLLTVWPWNVFIGFSTPNLQTCIHWSVEQEAKLVLLCQSTSSAGAEGEGGEVQHELMQSSLP